MREISREIVSKLLDYMVHVGIVSERERFTKIDIDGMEQFVDQSFDDQHAQTMDYIKWVGQTVHQGYHHDQPGTFWECPKSICDSAARTVKEWQDNGAKRLKEKVSKSPL